MIARPCRPKAGRVAEAADPVDLAALLPAAADQATMLAAPAGLLLVVPLLMALLVARLPVVLADLPLEPVVVLRQNR